MSDLVYSTEGIKLLAVKKGFMVKYELGAHRGTEMFESWEHYKNRSKVLDTLDAEIKQLKADKALLVEAVSKLWGMAPEYKYACIIDKCLRQLNIGE